MKLKKTKRQWNEKNGSEDQTFFLILVVVKVWQRREGKQKILNINDKTLTVKNTRDKTENEETILIKKNGRE